MFLNELHVRFLQLISKQTKSDEKKLAKKVKQKASQDSKLATQNKKAKSDVVETADSKPLGLARALYRYQVQ
jgi:hypothetical protein